MFLQTNNEYSVLNSFSLQLDLIIWDPRKTQTVNEPPFYHKRGLEPWIAHLRINVNKVGGKHRTDTIRL